MYKLCLKAAGLLLFILVMGLPLAYSSGITKGPVAKWVTVRQPDFNSPVTLGEVEDGYHYLQYDKQVSVADNAFYIHITQKIINQTGVNNCSQLEFSYDKAFEKILIHSIQIVRNGKVINKLDLSKLKVVQQTESLDAGQYDETMSGLLFLDDVQTNDVVDYSYTRISSNPLFSNKYTGSFTQRFGVPVSAIYYSITTPANRPLITRCFNKAVEPLQKTVGQNIVYDWHLTNVAAFKLEDGTPRGYFPFPTVDVSEYKSWAEVVQWALNIYQPVMQYGSKVRAKAANIKSSYTEEEDRIIAALRYVQDEVRYLGMETGINTHRPHLPEQVMAQGYGDCKDKSLLFCSLLKEMGIEAYPVLIRTDAYDDMGGYLPSPNLFDHVCAVVNYKGLTCYVDPTLSYQRGRLLNNYFPNYKFGLVISEKSKGLAKIEYRPDNTATTVVNRFEMVDTISPTRLQVTTYFTGSDANDFRAAFAANSLAQLQKSYASYYTSIFKDIEITDSVKVIKDDSIENSIITTEVYTINNIWKKDEDGKYWSFEMYEQNLNSKLNKPDIRKRTMPIGVIFPQNYTARYEVQLFGEWNLEGMEESVENSAIKFHSASSHNRVTNIYTLELSLVAKSYQTDLSDMNTYCKDIDRIAENLGRTIYYRTGVAKVDKAASSSTSFFMVFVALLTIIIAVLVFRQIYNHYDVETEYTGQEPISFGGWLWLPLLGVCLTPFLVSYSVLSNGYFNESNTDIIFNKSAASYNPAFGGMLITELIFNVLLICTACFGIVLAVKRRSFFPYVYIAMLLVALTGQVVDLLGVYAGVISDAESSKTTGLLARTFIQCAIWIPYMLKSVRVRQTFTQVHPANQKKELTVSNDGPVNIPHGEVKQDETAGTDE